jgi:glucose/arabinose dehydrogenase
MPRRFLVALAAAALTSSILAGCGFFGGDAEDTDGTEPTPTATETPAATEPPATPTPPPSTAPRPTPTFPPVASPTQVDVVPAYDTLTFNRPTEVISYPLGRYEIVVAEQDGLLLGISEGQATTLLDLTDRIAGRANEEGLLSLALDPQFSTNRQVWVYYSAFGPRRTVLSRFTAETDGSIDRASELVVLEIEQPFANHNGGAVRFGPDRMLYLGIGDGGSAGDPQGHGQDLGTLLGTVVRIDVSRASEAEPYVVPDDNPFVGVEGARPEIWAYGLRNPWRMSFDPAEGDLWLADVGQNRMEEVNRVVAGGNYGWNVMEGTLCFADPNCDPAPYEDPLAVYTLDEGRCSVTGGVVARRVSATNLEGSYLFGDYCSGDLWALPSDTDGSAEAVLVASGLGRITSISQVGAQIYIVTFDSTLQRLVDR